MNLKHHMIGLCLGMVLTLTVLSNGVHAQAVVEVQRGAEVTRMIPASQNGNLIEIEGRVLELTVSLENGKKKYLEVLSLSDPISGLLWWRLQPKNFVDRREALVVFQKENAVYLTNTKLVCFHWSDSGFLTIKESPETGVYIEDVYINIITALEDRNAGINTEGAQTSTQILIGPHFPQDFLSFQPSPAPQMDITIKDVMRQGQQWHIQFQSFPDKKAEIILDDHYQFVP